MNILYIIPARGGSKGLVGKNLKQLDNYPMIYYSIAAAKKTKHAGEIVVSSDSSEVLKIASDYGCSLDKRPDSLARDESSIVDTVLHILKNIKKKPDVIVLLQPTSPLRTFADIDGCIDLFIKSKLPSVVSVCLNSHPIGWSVKLTIDGKLEPVEGWDNFLKRRQDFESTYFVNGAVYVIDAVRFAEQKSFFIPGKTAAYPMPPDRSVDVDNMTDFLVARALIKKEF